MTKNQEELKLKKKPIMILAAVALTAVLMIGCSPAAQIQAADMSALQQQLEQISGDISSLKADVEGLKAGAAQQDTSAADNTKTESAPPASEAPAATATPIPQASAGTRKSTGDYDIAGLTDKVNAVIGKMEAATAQNMFDVKSEAKAVEREIEMQEDTAEYDYRQGSLSRADYGSIDSELGRLEDQLDHAEDAMEFRLGYDD